MGLFLVRRPDSLPGGVRQWTCVAISELPSAEGEAVRDSCLYGEFKAAGLCGSGVADKGQGDCSDLFPCAVRAVRATFGLGHKIGPAVRVCPGYGSWR
jgi:hypothetical protein